MPCTPSHNLKSTSPFSCFSEIHGATGSTFSCLSASSADKFNSDDDVEGTSSDSTELLTRGRRSFFSISWLLLGRFSVGTLPVTRIFLVGSKDNLHVNATLNAHMIYLLLLPETILKAKFNVSISERPSLLTKGFRSKVETFEFHLISSLPTLVT